MAFPKTLLLGLVFAVLILIFSEVSARELAETTTAITDGGGEVAKDPTKPGLPCGSGSTNRNCHRAGGHEHRGEVCNSKSKSKECHGKGGHERGGGRNPNKHGGKGSNEPGEHGPYNRIGKSHGHDHGHNEKPGRPAGTVGTETKN